MSSRLLWWTLCKEIAVAIVGNVAAICYFAFVYVELASVYRAACAWHSDDVPALGSWSACFLASWLLARMAKRDARRVLKKAEALFDATEESPVPASAPQRADGATP